ncbi:hypothetical protein Pst134EB_027647 [Puccinia striiformis f. sp. tritici]|nr:hypothetical protein Pst134EB_027647 [Puccinia striiformis f. sp. tritici]
MKATFSLPLLLRLQISTSLSFNLASSPTQARVEAVDVQPILSVDRQEDEIHQYLSDPLSFPETTLPSKNPNPTFHLPSTPHELPSQSPADEFYSKGDHTTNDLLPSNRFFPSSSSGLLPSTGVLRSHSDLTTGDANCRSDITYTGDLTSSRRPTSDSDLICYRKDLACKRKGQELIRQNEPCVPLVRKRVKVTQGQNDQKSRDRAIELLLSISDFNPNELQDIDKGTAKPPGSLAQSDNPYDRRQGSRKFVAGAPEDVANEFPQDEKTRSDQDSLHDILLEGLANSVDTRNPISAKNTRPGGTRRPDIGETLLALSDATIEIEKYDLFVQIMNLRKNQISEWASRQQNGGNACRTRDRILKFVKSITKMSTLLIVSHAKLLHGHQDEMITTEEVQEVLRFMNDFWEKMDRKESLVTSHPHLWLPRISTMLDPSDLSFQKKNHTGKSMWYPISREITRYWTEQNKDLNKSWYDTHGESDIFNVKQTVAIITSRKY